MNVSIDAKGEMVVKPENDLESYALLKWRADWENNIAVLVVEHDHPHVPGMKAASTISPKPLAE